MLRPARRRPTLPVPAASGCRSSPGSAPITTPSPRRATTASARRRASFAAALVFVPRARERRARPDRGGGRRAPGGPLIVEGAKTDGIDALLRDLRGPRRSRGRAVEGAWPAALADRARRRLRRLGRGRPAARASAAGSPCPAASRPTGPIAGSQALLAALPPLTRPGRRSRRRLGLSVPRHPGRRAGGQPSCT